MSRDLSMAEVKQLNWRLRLYSLSPWLLGGACILLLLILAFSAVANYEREKKLITAALEEKGLTLVRFVSSSTFDAIRSTARNSHPYEGWEAYMKPALELAVEQPEVECVSILDGKGNILISAGESCLISGSSTSTVNSLLQEVRQRKEPRLRRNIVILKEDGKEKALLATPFTFIGKNSNRNQPLRGLGMDGKFRRFHHNRPLQADLEKLASLHPIYLVQVDFTEFTAPLKRQLLQIVIELVAIFLVGVGGTLSFLTLRGFKGSEEKLGKMRGLNEALVASLPVGVIATGDDGNIQVINEPGEKIIGLTAVKVMGTMPAASLPPIFSTHFKSRGNSVAPGEVQEIEIAGRSLELTVVSIENDPSKGRVMLLRDITDLKKLEEELQRNERLALVGKMAAGVAHELRNPLSSIKGLALILQSRVSGEKESEKIAETFVDEVERLNRSIGELLDYARPQNLELEPCSLREIVAETLALLQPELEANSIQVVKDVLKSEQPVFLDRERIRQVFLNIFLNAIQAMEGMERSGEIHISIEHQHQYLSLKIRDNARGIESEVLKKIFDPYFTTRNNGTGLGLALSLKTVEEHGGRLLVDSCLGQWTEFQVLLPLG